MVKTLVNQTTWVPVPHDAVVFMPPLVNGTEVAGDWLLQRSRSLLNIGLGPGEPWKWLLNFSRPPLYFPLHWSRKIIHAMTQASISG